MKELQDRYEKEMLAWEAQYKIENKPKDKSLSEWEMEKWMEKPNKPGYQFANND